jgi:predicted heme/steroid binding protein
MEETRKFSLKDLATFNGKNGKLAYVGFKGKVYDVTESTQWLDGDHLGHAAGEDLTETMDIAPHDQDVLTKMKIVGVLV